MVQHRRTFTRFIEEISDKNPWCRLNSLWLLWDIQSRSLLFTGSLLASVPRWGWRKCPKVRLMFPLYDYFLYGSTEPNPSPLLVALIDHRDLISIGDRHEFSSCYCSRSVKPSHWVVHQIYRISSRTDSLPLTFTLLSLVVSTAMLQQSKQIGSPTGATTRLTIVGRNVSSLKRS